MERGFEQLFVLAAILLAAMVDLFVRWLRGKTRKDQPAGAAGVEEEVVLVEEADTELPEELPEQEPVEPQLPPPPPPAPRPSPPPPVRTRRRHRARRWLKHPTDARRGIVLMAILGRCRGLEAPY
ncbi:MAG: hypothetical protein WD825_17780 [Gemmatimonadaceae bacterium]